MGRYWVFAGDTYYARGGMDEFRQATDELDALPAIIEAMQAEYEWSWVEVLDTVTMRIVLVAGEMEKFGGFHGSYRERTGGVRVDHDQP